MSLVIGMNSGSSFDGIDAVLVEIKLAADGHPSRPRFIAGLAYEWPVEVEKLVMRAFSNELTIFELTRLHYVAGAVYAEAARKLMDDQGLRPDQIEVIGVDGQTIYQEPPNYEAIKRSDFGGDIVAKWLNGPYACGLQIGEPAIIATHCEVPVVWNYRPSDHALGGTGAPLMQYLDFVAFRDIGPVLTLNIGGIANCQLAEKDRSKMMAFDTGPGNVMMDHSAQKLLAQRYDANGEVAGSGTVNDEMLDQLKVHPFFTRRPPRSAWRLDFGADYAEDIMNRFAHLGTPDIMATFCAFTAWSIATSIKDHVQTLDIIPVLIVSGGGVRNPTLLSLLAQQLPGSLRLTTSDEFGIPPQFKEAVKFGTLAYATQRHLGNNIPAASGASRFAVMGKTVYPPRFALESLAQEASDVD